VRGVSIEMYSVEKHSLALNLLCASWIFQTD